MSHFTISLSAASDTLSAARAALTAEFGSVRAARREAVIALGTHGGGPADFYYKGGTLCRPGKWIATIPR